jgi:serine/threonine-protein kinase
MFPLIMPGPPRRMLYTAIVAGAMAPLGLLLLELTGRVSVADKGFYFEQSFASMVSAVFAYFGARIIYGLGKEVAEARELGSYHLGELLGKGGMGEVYKATHRMLARPSAIKLIRPEMLGGGDAAAAQVAVKRFHREATAAASLRSPHTVELYDFGVTEDQTLYFVMELLEGMDLETLVRQKGPLPAARVIHILRQVCESLEEAHSAGLVHRDIKPANIHIGRLGLTWDFVKVLDFGLVKSVEPAHDEHSLATAAGLAPGTPAYMPPEMAMAEAIDGRADLYSLGCVAYYLLTGRLVFEAANGMQMLARHMQEQPVPPSERMELPLPRELDRLVMACLAKRPAERPASAAELSRALGAIAVEPWGQEEAERWWDINRPG